MLAITLQKMADPDLVLSVGAVQLANTMINSIRAEGDETPCTFMQRAQLVAALRPILERSVTLQHWAQVWAASLGNSCC
jgi:hypothetical protein